MEENKENNIFKETMIDGIKASIPLLFLFLLNFFFIDMNFSLLGIAYRRGAVVFEFCITYLIGCFLLGLFKKGRIAIIVMGILFYALSILVQLKILFTGEPILISDILYLNDTGEIFGLVEGEFVENLKLCIRPLIIETLLFIIVGFMGFKLYKNINIENLKLRASLILIPIIILIVLFLPIQFLNKVLSNLVFDLDNRKDYAAFTSINEYYVLYGVVGGMYGQWLEDAVQKPNDYDENIIQKELSNVKENTNKKLGKPNIIVVFSESFFDIDQLDEIEFNKEITPNFNKLKEKGLFFDMISPSYGGLSANVEYEFLTGANLMYFNKCYVPYMQLYRNDNYYEVPSMISELNKNGYYTKIAAATSDNMFNCGQVYKYYRVDETEYMDDVDEKYMKGNRISDEYVTDNIIKAFNKKSEDSKMFYMAVTMQSHMPYRINKYEDYDVWVTKSDFSQDCNETLTSYAQGIYDADKELGRLYEYIQTLDEPTIIVFYGDHLPYLYADRDNIIDKLKYFNTGDKLLDEYRKYNTQSLIVSNFEMEKENDIKYLGPDLLCSYILNNMDIEISDYYKWLYSTKDTIGASNYLVTVDKFGNLYNTNLLNGNLKELYNIRRMIQYKLFIK